MQFELATNEARCWSICLDVSDQVMASHYAHLPSEERERSARFRFEADRRRFVVAHGVLRDLLGSYLGTSPRRIQFTYNAFGKPALSPEFGDRVKFNLSHSGDLALIAIATNAHVGVDIEQIVPQSNYLDIARTFFSMTELEELRHVPAQLLPETFYRCWTRREAYAKGCGAGLGGLRDGEDYCNSWSFHEIRPAPAYIGTVALRPV